MIDVELVKLLVLVFCGILLLVAIYKIVQMQYFKSRTMQIKLSQFQDVLCDYRVLYQEFLALKQNQRSIKFSQAYPIFDSNSNSFVISVSKFIADKASAHLTQYILKYFEIGKSAASISYLEDYITDALSLSYHQETLLGQTRMLRQSFVELFPVILRLGAVKLINKKLLVSESSLEVETYYLMLKYTSDKGRSSREISYELSAENVSLLLERVQADMTAKSTASSERAKLTQALRQQILVRDYYTCCNCGLSIQDEPNLLLEVDHIVPIAKGGKTVSNNLQTLCWKCNRAKGDDVEFGPEHPFVQRHARGKFRNLPMCSPKSLMSTMCSGFQESDNSFDITKLRSQQTTDLTFTERNKRNRQQNEYANAQYTGLSVSKQDLRGLKCRNSDFADDFSF